MAFKAPNMTSQLMTQQGMGRPGGSASRGSTPVPSSVGSGFAALEAGLLKKKKPPVKKLAPGSTARQFQKTAAE